MKRRSANARETAPGACSSGCGARAGRCPAGERGGDDADGGERDADADGFRHGAEHGAEDGAEDRGAERGPDQLAAALARGRDREPGERAGPGGRAREALDEPRETERPGPFRGREREAGDREQDEAGDDGALRAPARGGEAAGDAAEERAGAEGGDEQPGARLRKPELVRVAGNQRRERPEQHRVHEHDDGDENQKPTHELRTYRRRRTAGRGSAPQQLQGSPAKKRAALAARFLLANKFSEPVALSSAPPTDVSASAYSSSGGASTYSRSVLAARGNLGRLGVVVKRSKNGELANCGFFFVSTPQFAIRAFWTTKNSASRVRFRPPIRRTFGFRLRPTGSDSTYSRPVLAARGKLRPRARSVKAARSVAVANCGFFFTQWRICASRQTL